MAYPRAEVEATIQRLTEAFKEAERRNNWSWIADEFYHEDAVYTCPYGGALLVEARGREEIRKTHLGRDMEVGSGWKGWSFPIIDYGVNGDQVITPLAQPRPRPAPRRQLLRDARRLVHHLWRRR